MQLVPKKYNMYIGGKKLGKKELTSALLRYLGLGIVYEWII